MSIVKINALQVPVEQREVLEKRFASRAGSGTYSVKDLDVWLLGGGHLLADQHQHRVAGTG